jgi:muramoyltetrapeptide carboxypeptidase
VKTKEKLKPLLLHPGDTVGIVAPASPLYNKSDLVRGAETLEAMGYKPLFGKTVYKRREYLAGTDQERAADINAMFANKKVNAIFVTQGGYGSARILKYLDFSVIRKNPKIFLGFSDISIIHLAILKKTNVVTFHGPGMAGFNDTELTEYRKEYLFKALTTTEPIGEIRPASPKQYIHSIYPGQVEAEIVGGNLALICSTLGTPWEIDTKGKVLFLEEIDTEPWMIDHYLTHLSNAGKLDEIAGVVVGECINCIPFSHHPGFPVTFSLEELLAEFFEPLKKPALYGLPMGHSRDMATFPFGCKVLLDADEKKLFVTESGVIDK